MQSVAVRVGPLILAGHSGLRAGFEGALAPLGIQHIDTPLTPEKVWQAIQESGR